MNNAMTNLQMWVAPVSRSDIHANDRRVVVTDGDDNWMELTVGNISSFWMGDEVFKAWWNLVQTQWEKRFSG